jgi:hypothetical protein
MGAEKQDVGLSRGISGTSQFTGGGIETALYAAIMTKTVLLAAVAAGLPYS